MEKQIVAYAVAPQALQATLNVLGTMPYAQVANVMQALQQSQPIYSDQVQDDSVPALPEPPNLPAPLATNGAKPNPVAKRPKR